MHIDNLGYISIIGLAILFSSFDAGAELIEPHPYAQNTKSSQLSSAATSKNPTGRICGKEEEIFAHFSSGRVVVKRVRTPESPHQRSEEDFSLYQLVYRHARFPISLKLPENADEMVVRIGNFRFTYGRDHKILPDSPRRSDSINVSDVFEIQTMFRNYVAVIGGGLGAPGYGSRVLLYLIVDVTNDALPIEQRIMTASSWMLGGIENLMDVDQDGYLDLLRVWYVGGWDRPLTLTFFSGRTRQKIAPDGMGTYRIKQANPARDTWCLFRQMEEPPLTEKPGTGGASRR